MERLNRNSNSVLQNNGQAAVGSNVSNGNQAQLRFQNYRARFGRPYILNVPPQFQQPMYRPARHPWDGRVPPYPYHLQPQSTYFTNQFFPYPSTPVRPMVPRSEVFYTPQRVPYQVTTASRPPPPDSVLSYHQVPPSRPVITPVRGRARRQTEQRRDEQNPSMNPTPQGSAEEMGSRLTSPYDSNNSVTESIDLTRGSPDLMTASQPMPLQEYNWQTPAPEAQSEQVQTYQVASPDYNVQYIPVPQNQMSHHMVPPTSQMCGQELEPYQMPIYQPVVQSILKPMDQEQLPSSPICVCPRERFSPYCTRSSTSTPSRSRPRGRCRGCQENQLETSNRRVRNSDQSTSTSYRPAQNNLTPGLSPQQPREVTSIMDVFQELNHISEMTQNMRREPNYLSASMAPSISPPQPTSPDTERSSMVNNILQTLEELLPEERNQQQFIKNPFDLRLPLLGSPNPSTPMQNGSVREGVRTLDHMLPDNFPQQLTQEVPPLLQPSRDSSVLQERQIELTTAVPEVTLELPQDTNSSPPLLESRNSLEDSTRNDDAESLSQISVDISMFDTTPEYENIVQEVRNMTIDGKQDFNF
ncbi:uncharacterized protein [Halyomorpha halys]|uniref:uncharacterized protein isoform X1 n=1 Tax=Halyomorpha halys TaxID=286706 RepID=UPI0006D50561|nr:uncharacterized protein LOC106681800 isoform X1 [Halyomorpha halys]